MNVLKLLALSCMLPVMACARCTSALDCSLNGDCLQNACVCDPAWSGNANCSLMAFQQLDRQNMPGYYNASEASWGGFPIQEGGEYALIHAQMVHGCPLGTWTSNSAVVMSRSTTGTIEGPYAYAKELLPSFAHNPTIRRAPDGTFVIFYIGGWPTQPSNCSSNVPPAQVSPILDGGTCTGQNWPKSCGPEMPGPMKDCCGPADAPYQGNSGCGIQIASSKTLDGPWTVQPLVIANQWESDDVYCTHTNPSPVFLPNGTVVLAFNAGFCNGHLETIGIAVADSWQGPYNLLVKNSVLKNPDGTAHHCEDPHLWKSERGWHLLTHNQQAPQGESSYAFSLDGLDWALSPVTPYNCTVWYTDGSSAEMAGCGNRPQIVFQGGSGPDQGPNPVWLINGATSSKPVGSQQLSWTLFRRLLV